MIREATAEDDARLVELIAQLGFGSDVGGVAARRVRLADIGEPILVAETSDGIVGVIDWHVMTTIHRPSPVGRIVMLVIDESHRGEGTGTALVKSACDRMRAAGCKLIEVTSNDRLVDAHRFYEGLGFEATSRRFAKPL